MKKYLFIILQIIIGFLLADFVAGILHWFEDTYLQYCVDIPILSGIAKDNEMHHYFPRSIISYNYIEHMTYSLPISMITILLIYLVNKRIFVKYPYFITTFFIISSTGNIIHRFSHMRDCENNWFVKCMQKSGIFCSHSHHSLHHLLSDEKYCVISEFNNYILDTILFWRGLEYVIYLITDIKPSRKPSYDDYSEIQNHMHDNAKKECPDKPTHQDVEELHEKLKDYINCNPDNKHYN